MTKETHSRYGLFRTMVDVLKFTRWIANEIHTIWNEMRTLARSSNKDRRSCNEWTFKDQASPLWLNHSFWKQHFKLLTYHNRPAPEYFLIILLSIHNSDSRHNCPKYKGYHMDHFQRLTIPITCFESLSLNNNFWLRGRSPNTLKLLKNSR